MIASASNLMLMHEQSAVCIIYIAYQYLDDVITGLWQFGSTLHISCGDIPIDAIDAIT